MAIARVHTWVAGEILLASDLNSEFNNLINNGSDLVSPFTKAISMGGFALNLDAANTIAFTGTTSGVTLAGGTLREPTQDTITAFATGGQTNATALTVGTKFHRISVCATAADSYKLPTSTAGQCHYVRNDGAAAAQAFGAGTDTINGVATATGIPHPVGVGIWFVCTTAGNWTTGPLVAVSGNFPVTLTATAATGVTLPTTGTLATLAGTEVLTNKTISAGTFSGAGTLSGTLDRVAIATAIGKIIPGATSLSLRNNADNADNLIITDAGNATLRGTLTGPSTMLSPITNSLSVSVSLNNSSNYFDGPSVAQGTSGTWFASGTVMVNDSTNSSNYIAKLWDGTTVISIIEVGFLNTVSFGSISLSGFITSPAGNLRISVKEVNATTGVIYGGAVDGLTGKTSTLTAIRIA